MSFLTGADSASSSLSPRSESVFNDSHMTRVEYHMTNESTTGADASVEALKLYHMKLTLALIVAY